MLKILFTLPLLITLSCTQNITYSEIELKPESKKVSINDEVIQLEEGESTQFNGSVEFNDGNSTTDVLWYSDNPGIVKVEPDGKITALKAGDASLTVVAKQDTSKKAYLKIKVNQYVERKVEVNVGTEGKLVNNFNLISSENNVKPGTISTPKSTENSAVKPTVPPTQQKLNIPVTSVSGKVFDVHGFPVEDATVNIVSLDKTLNWNSVPQKTFGGNYLFKEIPANTLLRIDVVKEGWIKASRTEVLKEKTDSNLNSLNVFNFGGDNKDDSFALQNEPQINNVTINSQRLNQLPVESNGINPDNPPESLEKANIKLPKTSLINIVMNFSQEIEPASFENNFQIISQSFDNTDSYTIDKVSSNVTFSWNPNNTQVTINTELKNIPNLNDSIYRIQFKEEFIDKSGKSAVKGRFIKSGNQLGDYLFFSVSPN